MVLKDKQSGRDEERSFIALPTYGRKHEREGNIASKERQERHHMQENMRGSIDRYRLGDMTCEERKSEREMGNLHANTLLSF